MGALKPKMVLRLFEQLGFQTIVLADTDTVWLRDPESMPRMLPGRAHCHSNVWMWPKIVPDACLCVWSGFIAAHESADMFISTGPTANAVLLMSKFGFSASKSSCRRPGPCT